MHIGVEVVRGEGTKGLVHARLEEVQTTITATLLLGLGGHFSVAGLDAILFHRQWPVHLQHMKERKDLMKAMV